MATSKIDRLMLDHQLLDAGQEQRLRRARRTAAVVGVIAIAVFVFSILQMVWLQHNPPQHPQVTDSLMQ
ncbi:hypothetical protein GCM10007862_25150 [Dyella lipolytica]|uniref:Uncharacterized protein n=1 Tax=Dyella lipolytica TaxID=1867835 RepID=A0ABW8IRJ7_9GAMM|nr:hypothetical protein [Dyella lipolytica]GLQ47464.1 hypothetical protein GCM10007862_25150 [Dyella lipolytica]